MTPATPKLEPDSEDYTPQEVAELAARFWLRLLRYFEARVRLAEDAEELMQEVFVRLLRRTATDAIVNPESFLFMTAANLLKDHYRARARRTEVHSIDGIDLVSSAPGPAALVEGKGEISVLLGAIQELPPKCRAVFVMYRFDEMPHSEIAK